MKNVGKLMEKTVQASKSWKNGLGMCFWYNLLNYFRGSWSLKSECGP